MNTRIDAGSPPARDAWLTNLDRARELARALLRDPHAADDVVQEACVRALRASAARSDAETTLRDHEEAQPQRRSEDDERGRARAWFDRIVRNLASNHRRAGARRDEHEQAREPRSPEPSPIERSEELELQRVLVAELLTLEEPLRATIVRRFHHGLTCAEIARQDAAPESTVRARERRGLELLRERLDRRHGGQRSAWALLFLRFTDPARRLQRAAPAGGLASAAFLAAAGLLVGLGVFVAFRGGAGDAESNAVAARASTVEAAGPSELDATKRSEAARAPLAGDAHADGLALVYRVLGRFVDDQGAPLAGAEIAPEEGETGFEPRAPDVSGADGRFEALLTSERAPEGWHGPDLPRYVRLVARRAGHAPALCKVVLPPNQPVDIGTVALARSGGLRGRVVDSARRPVPGVECIVTAPDLEPLERARWPRCEPRAKLALARATTDADGRFDFASVPAGWVRVFARREGWEPVASATLEVAQGAQLDVGELATDAQTGWVAGRVVGADGAPLARSLVLAVERAEGVQPALATANDDGTFALRVGGTCDLYALGTARAPSEGVRLGVAPGSPNVELATTRSTSAALTLRTAAAPVEGWVTAAWELLPGRTIVAWAGKVRDGRIPFPRLPIATRFVVHAERYGTIEVAVPSDLASGATVEAVLAPVPVLQGRVVDVQGVPVAGASVLLTYPSPEPVEGAPESYRSRPGIPNRIVVSGADGSFLVAREHDFPYAFVVHDRNLRRSETHLYLPGGPDEARPFELVLGPFARIEGRVLVGPGDRPEKKRVVTTSGDGLTRETLVDGEGRYALEGLNAGSWRIWVDELPEDETRAVYPPSARTEIVLESGRTANLDFDLRDLAPCTLAGRITLEGVESRAWTLFWHRDDALADGAAQAPIGADGRFRARVLPAGRTWFRAVDDGLGPEARRVLWRLELEPGDQTAAIDVPTGWLTITAPHLAGRELAHVWRGPNELEIETRLRLDAQGHSTALRVPTGPAHLYLIDAQGTRTPTPLAETKVDPAPPTHVELPAPLR